mgnify:CR=1 FL=1
MPELSTETYPLLPLTSGVVLPGMVVTATLETPESRSASSAAGDTGGYLLLVPKVDGRYATVGTVAKIENAGELPNGQLAVVVLTAVRGGGQGQLPVVTGLPAGVEVHGGLHRLVRRPRQHRPVDVPHRVQHPAVGADDDQRAAVHRLQETRTPHLDHHRVLRPGVRTAHPQAPAGPVQRLAASLRAVRGTGSLT